jgi:hypothetical protein
MVDAVCLMRRATIDLTAHKSQMKMLCKMVQVVYPIFVPAEFADHLQV